MTGASAETRPLAVISSWPPRPCGIATFAEEALEFVRREMPERPIHVICHTDGRGENVHPIIDLNRADWYQPVVALLRELHPYAVHIEHEYGLYNHVDARGQGDMNAGFVDLLESIRDLPTVLEPHTVHGRLCEQEALFWHRVAPLVSVLVLKCAYQQWRMAWTFTERGWEMPGNVTVIPHGARPDIRFSPAETDPLKDELGLSDLKGRRLAGLVGWIQSNKRWDIIIEMWPEIEQIIYGRTGESWVLFGAGTWRDPNHKPDYERYVSRLRALEDKGSGRFFEFTPRGAPYYKVMALCDFVMLPSVDETQSGTLARIIALNKPFVTTAPMEGLTSQAIESGGGLLFTDLVSLRRQIVSLATDENLRWTLGESLKWYLDNVVSWDLIARQYVELYGMARQSRETGAPLSFARDF